MGDNWLSEKIKQCLFGDISNDEVKKRLYDNIKPYNYHFYDGESSIKRVKDAVKRNESEFDKMPVDYRYYSKSRDDIYAEYLGIPKNRRHNIENKTIVSDADYFPTIGSTENLKKINLTDWDVATLINSGILLKHGENKVDNPLGDYFADHTVGRGFDDNGDYISYYDKWDVNPYKGKYAHLIGTMGFVPKKIKDVEDLSFGIGKPVEYYDRVYLDDYYDIPEEARGNPFITPSIVTAYKKGGRIHIKKKNRGKFTEYCGGKVTEECIAKGKKSKDPKIRKRATFAANARKWKHENGGILKAQEGTSELYPAGIATPSNETIDFFKDFAQRYKKLNRIDKNQLIQGLISNDKAIVSNRGLPKYNTDTKQIFIPSDDMGVSTYSHELTHKLNDLVLERTDKERKLLNDAYPLSIAKYVYGRAPEDMRNELIEDERFSTNTELRRKISSDYGNVLGKKLNKIIKSLSTNDIINYVNNINGYVGESDFLKYPEHIIDGKTLFEHWKEDYDVPEYDNVPWEELPKYEQNRWQYIYDSREGVAPNYMIFDEDKPKAIKKALIKVAQESKSNNIHSKNFINVARQGDKL